LFQLPLKELALRVNIERFEMVEIAPQILFVTHDRASFFCSCFDTVFPEGVIRCAFMAATTTQCHTIVLVFNQPPDHLNSPKSKKAHIPEEI
jgi:hypothetical protein